MPANIFNAKITKLATYLATFLVAILISKNAYAETPTLSFSASSASNGGVVEMETLAPTSTAGAYTSGSDTLSITTTCSAGHSVYVSATSDNNYGTNLVNSDDPNNTNGNSIIPTSSASIGSEAALSGNMWGIRYGSGNTYAGLPAYSSDISGDITPIYTGTNTTIPIYYGINVTPTLAPGEYSGKVLYTVLMASECEKEPEPEPTTQDTTTADYCTGSEYGCMQDFVCESLPLEGTTTLIDKRDGNTYTVYRIQVTDTASNISGKCFMQSALRLGSTLGTSGSTGDQLIVSEDASAYYPQSSTSSVDVFPNEGAIGINFVSSTDAAKWDATNINTNRQFTWGTGEFDFGYYTWGAAIVACPAGWRLPTRAEYGDNLYTSSATRGIAKLVSNSATGSTALRNQSGVWLFPTYGGYYDPDIGFQNQTAQGRYWTATTYLQNAQRFQYTANNVYTNNHGKQYGLPVRCITGDATQATTSMQSFSCSSLSAGDTAYLYDARDNNTYSVYRVPTNSTASNIAGKCFMQSALRLGSELGSSGSTGDKLTVSPALSNYDTNASSSSYESFSLGTSAIEINYVKNTEYSSNWSGTNSYANRQMTWGTSSYDFGYYSWGAALVVCPAGWRLPIGTEYGTYGPSNTQTTGIGKIVGNSSTGSTALRDQSGVWKFPSYGGYFHSGSWQQQSTTGRYWIATQFNVSNGQAFGYTADKVYVGNSGKYTGKPVRCIAD